MSLFSHERKSPTTTLPPAIGPSICCTAGVDLFVLFTPAAAATSARQPRTAVSSSGLNRDGWLTAAPPRLLPTGRIWSSATWTQSGLACRPRHLERARDPSAHCLRTNPDGGRRRRPSLSPLLAEAGAGLHYRRQADPGRRPEPRPARRPTMVPPAPTAAAQKTA
jgi:hypothetical protein